MFRHQGKNRNFSHNLKLASQLSFVAGIVNIIGVLGLRVLTTNVTGHFAYFSEDLSNKNYGAGLIYLGFIFSFLLGAFFSNLLVEWMSRIKPAISFIAPMIIEIIILLFVAVWPQQYPIPDKNANALACALLFAMGLQNSLVTQVSSSAVRTTHLTGLFTDLGIELSQLLFYHKVEQFSKLKKSINLKLAIIFCFFAGCIFGGYFFKLFALKTLLFAAVFVLVALFYDAIRFQYYQIKRKVQS